MSPNMAEAGGDSSDWNTITRGSGVLAKLSMFSPRVMLGPGSPPL